MTKGVSWWKEPWPMSKTVWMTESSFNFWSCHSAWNFTAIAQPTLQETIKQEELTPEILLQTIYDKNITVPGDKCRVFLSRVLSFWWVGRQFMCCKKPVITGSTSNVIQSRVKLAGNLYLRDHWINRQKATWMLIHLNSYMLSGRILCECQVLNSLFCHLYYLTFARNSWMQSSVKPAQIYTSNPNNLNRGK